MRTNKHIRMRSSLTVIGLLLLGVTPVIEATLLNCWYSRLALCFYWYAFGVVSCIVALNRNGAKDKYFPKGE